MVQPTITDEVANRIKNLQEEIDQLQVNINALEQQHTLISSASGAINDAINVLDELKSKKIGDEILIPIGGSNYILCTVKDPERTFISLGSGFSIRTDVEDSRKRNKDQIKKLENSINKIQDQYLQFSQMLSSRRQELLQIAQEHQILR